MANVEGVRERILEYILKNKVSSVEVADALGKKGVIPEVKALNRGHFVAAVVFYAYAYGESNFHLHYQLKTAPENSIVFVEAIECGRRALFGDLVSKFLLLYRKVSGIVVKGYLRDVHRLIKENYPIWFMGGTPLGCFNREVPVPENMLEYAQKQKEYYEGGLMVCDDSGCTFISKENLSENFLKKLEFIECQEDIWYYCLDTLKWDTFDIVCQKRYLKETEVLPPILKRILEFEV